MAHGVAVQIQLFRDGIHAAAVPEERLECVEERVVAVLRDERTEDARGKGTDVVGWLREHEAERPQLVEVDRAPVAGKARAPGSARAAVRPPRSEPCLAR